MCPLGARTIILPMTPPISSTKILLIPDSRGPSSRAPRQIRRFRIARLQLEGAAPAPEKPFGHLGRMYD